MFGVKVIDDGGELSIRESIIGEGHNLSDLPTKIDVA